MKIKEGYKLREVAGNYIVVATGKASKEFNGMINLNETGALLWRTLEKGAEEKDLINALLAEYEVDEATATTGVKAFIEKVVGAGFVE